MKKLKSLSALVVISVLTISCGNKPTKVLPATELAFCDFILGGSFNECYESAANSQRYYYLSKKTDGFIDYASFISVGIPNYKSPDDTISVMRGEIEGYQDRIYSISYQSVWTDEVLEMYQAKYGVVEPRKREYDLSDYHYTNLYYFWVFENGRITIKDEQREPLHYTLHRGHNVYVTYFDDSLRETVDAHKAALEAKRDSLKRVEEERERKEKEMREQEAARIKGDKQKEIVNSFRF